MTGVWAYQGPFDVTNVTVQSRDLDYGIEESRRCLFFL